MAAATARRHHRRRACRVRRRSARSGRCRTRLEAWPPERLVQYFPEVPTPGLARQLIAGAANFLISVAVQVSRARIYPTSSGSCGALLLVAAPPKGLPVTSPLRSPPALGMG